MSKITYSGIELGFIRTTQYSNSAEADKDNPDLMYRVDDLRVTSVLAESVVPKLVGETLQACLQRVQEELARPRRPFVYQIGGVDAISLPGGLDDANGPFPYGVSVELVADASFLISWGIKIRRSDCGGRLNAILSNRWSETATIGDDHLTTLRRTGRLVVSNRTGINPDAYRELVTPRIGQMMVRKTSEYTLHENGLELAYNFVDEEKFVMPPYPAIKARGRMSESSTNHLGTVRHGRVFVELTGPPDVSKKILLGKCVELALARALQGGLQSSNGRYIAGGGIDEDLFNNTVGLTITWLMRETEQRILKGQSWGFTNGIPWVQDNLQGGNPQPAATPPPPKVNDKNEVISSLAMKGGWVGEPLVGTLVGHGIAPPTRGDLEWLQLVSAAFSDPCLSNYFANLGRGPLIKKKEPDKGTHTESLSNRSTVVVAPILPPEPTGGAIDPNDRSDAIYDSYSCVCHYIHDSGMEVAPAMKANTAGKAFRLSGESMRLEVEFTARRVGKPPVIPEPKTPTDYSGGPGWIYISGTVSPVMVEVAGDGRTFIHTVSGVYRFKATDPCKANVIAPFPPYLARNLDEESRLAAAYQSNTIIFFAAAAGLQPVNPFCIVAQPQPLGGAQLRSVPPFS